MAITKHERETIQHLVNFWNEYLTLLNTNDNDTQTIKEAIHNIEYVMAMRIARRVDPNFWE